MYTPDTGRRSISPARELSDVSETGSNGRRVSRCVLNISINRAFDGLNRPPDKIA